MEYDFRRIEKDWQKKWQETNAYKVSNDSAKPKFYVLDMFPYPSGAGLHVGHPLGYIASDIYSRYKRLKGFNVLHPMGFDSFGLPAEQYALDTGQHPAETTKKNIATFKAQLDNIGFCFDWSREVRTSDPAYYKWTQWIFLQLFNSWYNRKEKKAERIEKLEEAFNKEGNTGYPCPGDAALHFSADQWKAFDEKERADILMNYRLAYCGYGEVNWCEALGTVLANDEVINGVSERGGYPVVKKKLRQWYLRITEYADRLLEGLDRIDFSEAMKEMQTNWIGKSSGAEIEFPLKTGFASPQPSPGGEGVIQHSESGKFFQTADTKIWQTLKEYGRTNRKNPTEAEDIIWHRIRNNQLGVKVRRQHAVQGYIVDFALLEVKLVIEIDGGYHNEEEQKIYDRARTEYLKEFGLELIRFNNDEVISNPGKVINDIKAAIEQQKKKLKTKVANGDQSPLLLAEKGLGDEAPKLRVYTTRPDTIFGVDFMVIAPEHELVEQITTAEQKEAVEEYIAYVKSRSERERMAEKKISGVFTGAYALNPFDDREIPVWISEYVLAGYGTGAIMAVPCGDERDFKFAKHFNIPVTNIIGKYFDGEEANPTKEAILENSGFLDGLVMKEAMEVAIKAIEENGIGVRKVNYKMRDAAFSRQRYWGEPFPVVWKNGIAYPLPESELPLELPHVDSYKPGPDGEGPLANIPEWTAKHLETNTMPGYAGSSWYFLRYMDPHNDKAFCDRKVSDYWGQVDLYIGGTEHAVGHLLYSRMWTKALYDLGYIGHDEPYKKLVNQGMIQGSSRFVYRIEIIGFVNKIPPGSSLYVSFKHYQKISELIDYGVSVEDILDYLHELAPHIFSPISKITRDTEVRTSKIHVDVNFVDGFELDIEAFRKWRDEYQNAEFILEDGKYICGSEVEKMSKSKFNTVNPDDLVARYGADTFRMYEMFLGPVEMSKPWDTKGIEGVHRFLKKLWRLFYKETNAQSKETSKVPAFGGDLGEAVWTNEKATDAELKVLHKTIKKIEDDTERFSFNTGVSTFMIAVNELTDLKCHKKEILEPLLILLTPYAPHIAEELYAELRKVSPLGGDLEGASVLDASFPVFEAKYVTESSKEYPISVNGKMRTTMDISLSASQDEVEKLVLDNDIIKKWTDGKPPKKIIYVKNKMVNVVI
ncbi:MAG: class I tRNA ligase family protein [Bacteroidota bacterium]